MKGILYPNTERCEEGFTLIEIMITLAVVVIALAGFLASNTAIQQTGESVFEKGVAIQDANRVIERMRDAARNDPFPGAVTGLFPNNAVVAGFNNLTNEQVSVSYVNAGADPLDVTVNVAWLSNGRRPSTTSLRTLITQRG